MNDTLENDSGNNYIIERNRLLKDVPYVIVRRAWFTLSHLLLDEGSNVVDMGCDTGILTYAMAALAPQYQFTGVDKSKRIIKQAKETYKLPNLSFKIGDVSSDIFRPESFDAVINNFILHEVFSNARYNEQIVSDTLRKHFKILKNEGTLFIRDYAHPPHGEYVLMEMHDKESHGEELSQLSEVDLLRWYAEHARPKQDPGCGGFFLEELAPRFPHTRIFRLPYKWAYEFIMRKGDLTHWERDLPFEYTYFTVDEFRQELRGLGARVQYSAPHWDESFIVKNFDGHFRLLHENGDTMGDPATSFIAVAQKMPERTSLGIEERRLSSKSEGNLEIKAMRDEHNGKVMDVVTRQMELAEVIPYRTTDEGRLYVYLHDGITRGLVNAVSRSGINIDGRQWSGHMVEAIATDIKPLLEMGEIDQKGTHDFAHEYLGLNPEWESLLEKGPEYYPDPTYIDERVHTYYLEVKKASGALPVKSGVIQTKDVQTKGKIREFNAQTILDAIAVGLIPNARLELQILSLFHQLKMKAENWVSKEISIISGEISSNFGLKDFLRQASNSDKRFLEVKRTVGDLRKINSIFVEEGQSKGGRTGISSQGSDFVISDEKTINSAVVIPITSSTKGDLHAGFLIKHLPVPERFQGNGVSIAAPQFDIPKEITNFRMLKQFIAEKFGVTPDMVIKLGESYYTHLGITPQRVHPFAVTAPPAYLKNPDTKFLPIYQYMLLWSRISKEPHFMTTLARAYRYMPAHLKAEAKKEVLLMLEERFKAAQPDWALPASFEKPQNAKGKPEEKKPAPQEEIPKAEKPQDHYKKKKLEKKEKKERKKRGSEAITQAKTEADTDAPTEAHEQDPPLAAKKINPIDLDLVEEFEKEIKDIRDALDDDFDDKPRPEKW